MLHHHCKSCFLCVCAAAAQYCVKEDLRPHAALHAAPSLCILVSSVYMWASRAAFCTSRPTPICSFTCCTLIVHLISCLLWASSTAFCRGEVIFVMVMYTQLTCCTLHHHAFWFPVHCAAVQRQTSSFCRERAAGFSAHCEPAPKGKSCVSADRVQQALHRSAAYFVPKSAAVQRQNLKLVFVQRESSRLLRHLPLCLAPVPDRDTLCAGPVSLLQCHNLLHDLLLHRCR